jgi:RND family efflux transporter MFP subunit
MLTDRRMIAAAVVAVLALASFLRSPALPVEAAAVERGVLALRVTTNGKVEPVQEAEVRARLDGRIVEIPEPGTNVSEGDVILRIDAGPVSSELAKAQSERLAALESMRAARSKLRRQRQITATDDRLFEEGAIAKERHAESRAALREAQARVAYLESEVPLRVDSLDHRIKDLEDQQTSSVLTAPVTGSVYRTERRRGEVVHAGDPILWIADLSDLRVRANIDQVDLGRVRGDQRVEITSNAFPGRLWTGIVSEVIPHVVVRQSRSISEGLAKVEPPTEGLVPGMSVDVDIVVEQSEDALRVPAEAIFRSNGDAFVYRIEGSRARRIDVALGLETVNAVQVTEGLEADDVVVLGPATELAEGDRVAARIRDVADH